MHFTDILSLCVSILGLYGLVYYLRFLIPRNVLPRVSAVLTEVEHLLCCAESTSVILQSNDHRLTLAICANEFLRMRTESHRAPGILQQLQLAVRCGLTYRLYTLLSRIEAIKIKIELAMDERQLTSLSTTQFATATAMPEPTPVDNMRLTCHEIGGYILVIIAAIVMTNVVEHVSHRRHQTLFPKKCSEPIDLALCSPDQMASHFA